MTILRRIAQLIEDLEALKVLPKDYFISYSYISDSEPKHYKLTISTSDHRFPTIIQALKDEFSSDEISIAVLNGFFICEIRIIN